MQQNGFSLLARSWLLSLLWFGVVSPLTADSTSESFRRIGQRWDEIVYHQPKSHRADALNELLEDVRRLKQRYPGQAEPLIWEAITLVTQASLNPGLSALSLAAEARDLLLHAVEIDPNAMQGAAYLTLACLYYKVPGWPLSFGDPETAERYFRKALALNPDGIESHYYYGHFLSKTGRIREAFAHFQQVARLPAAPTQPYLSLKLKRKAEASLHRLVVQAKL